MKHLKLMDNEVPVLPPRTLQRLFPSGPERALTNEACLDPTYYPQRRLMRNDSPNQWRTTDFVTICERFYIETSLF